MNKAIMNETSEIQNVTFSWVKSEDNFDEFEDHEDAFGAKFDEELEAGGDNQIRVGRHHFRG